MADPSIERFRRVVSAAHAHLEERRKEVNDLNVFPVADGDTGDNMALTLRAVSDELDRLDGQMVDEVGTHRTGQRARPRRADGRSRKLRSDPQPDRPRRRRGARQPAGRAGRPDAGLRGVRAGRGCGLRVGSRARRGDDADRVPGDGALDLEAPRPHGGDPPVADRDARRAGRAARGAAGGRRRATASRPSPAHPSSSRCSASPASSTPAPTALS